MVRRCRSGLGRIDDSGGFETGRGGMGVGKDFAAAAEGHEVELHDFDLVVLVADEDEIEVADGAVLEAVREDPSSWFGFVGVEAVDLLGLFELRIRVPHHVDELVFCVGLGKVVGEFVVDPSGFDLGDMPCEVVAPFLHGSGGFVGPAFVVGCGGCAWDEEVGDKQDRPDGQDGSDLQSGFGDRHCVFPFCSFVPCLVAEKSGGITGVGFGRRVRWWKWTQS